MALRKKKLIIQIDFSYQNLNFLYFLLRNNYISNFEKKSFRNKSFFLVTLKYSQHFSAIQNFSSIAGIKRKTNKKQPLKINSNKFLTVDLFSYSDKKGQLLAKIR